ncbi:hypothetical protein D8674_034097 [Pyrus ussuriensis x Pyrus communis]|uniref:Uncharacterized protein n=1 Tax=Pyrus ussuriensis x Pyrus communis TaxID=2448454 RepID=A0A5N5HT26_9ROSA|nr:hypothetical protein D8674_034097 [Pyrus ussuriensis x Pyrus communis]
MKSWRRRIWRLRRGKGGGGGFGSDGGYVREKRSSRASSSDDVGHVLPVGGLDVGAAEGDGLVVGPVGRREEVGETGLGGWVCWDWVSIEVDWRWRMKSSCGEDGGEAMVGLLDL